MPIKKKITYEIDSGEVFEDLNEAIDQDKLNKAIGYIRKQFPHDNSHLDGLNSKFYIMAADLIHHREKIMDVLKKISRIMGDDKIVRQIEFNNANLLDCPRGEKEVGLDKCFSCSCFRGIYYKNTGSWIECDHSREEEVRLINWDEMKKFKKEFFKNENRK